MDTLKPVRFKVAWQTYRVGDVIKPAGLLRSWLLANGYVEPAVDDPVQTSAPARKTKAQPSLGRAVFR